MIALALLLAAAAPAQAYKLLPGAQGKSCLECHKDFEAKLKKPFVHTPVRSQQCTGCHNPHASRHGKLLAAEPDRVCASCHRNVVPAQAKSSHEPVEKGKCASCHDPHASDEKFELVGKGAQLCAGCHKALVEQTLAAKVPHKPIEQGGCTSCHQPHGSTKGEKLLRSDEKSLCLSCHASKNPAFARAHMNYPVAQSRCTGCHDPHGSSKKGMLFDNVHRPLANAQCGECHLAPAKGTAVKAEGAALCKQCHAGQMAQMLDKARVHAAVIEPEACLNCHTPHASRERGLLKGNLTQVCAGCHADTIARQERSPTQHAPVRDGSCATCHDPHASDAVLMLKKASIEQCGTCHDYQRHSTHPIGAKVKDPRNRNLTLDCLSCHRAHGTEYKHMIPYPTPTEMCVKCHERFKR
jgi:predicted CXXCH cytochrome family protein